MTAELWPATVSSSSRKPLSRGLEVVAPADRQIGPRAYDDVRLQRVEVHLGFRITEAADVVLVPMGGDDDVQMPAAVFGDLGRELRHRRAALGPHLAAEVEKQMSFGSTARQRLGVGHGDQDAVAEPDLIGAHAQARGSRAHHESTDLVACSRANRSSALTPSELPKPPCESLS